MSSIAPSQTLLSLKGGQLTELCRALEVPTYGAKARKVERIEATLADLEARDTEEAIERIAEVRELLDEMLRPRDAQREPDEETLREELGGANETSSKSSNSGDSISVQLLTNMFAQSTGVLQAQNATRQARTEERLAPDLPTFSGTGDPRYTTSEWIAVIERYAQEFQWSQYQKLRYAAGRLVGPAKLWQERAGKGLLEYNAWKRALSEAIPDRTYSWEEKRKLLERLQRNEESIEAYMLDKWATASRFGLALSDAKEFLLRGLYNKNIAQTLAGRSFATVAEIISAAQEVQRIIGDTGRKTSERPSRFNARNNHAGQASDRHISRDCPKKRQASTKPKTPAQSSARVHKIETTEEKGSISAIVHEIRTEDKQRKSKFARTALINGKEFEAAIDAQSDISLIREDAVSRAGALSDPEAKITITGVTRNCMQTKGMGYYNLQLEDVFLDSVRFFVMPKEYMSAELWLGKNVLDDSRVPMIAGSNTRQPTR
ncbi:enzymatic poly-like protein, partial [Dinothrombium tinctorium]